MLGRKINRHIVYGINAHLQQVNDDNYYTFYVKGPSYGHAVSILDKYLNGVGKTGSGIKYSQVLGYVAVRNGDVVAEEVDKENIDKEVNRLINLIDNTDNDVDKQYYLGRLSIITEIYRLGYILPDNIVDMINKRMVK